jgi:hypothetical protein
MTVIDTERTSDTHFVAHDVLLVSTTVHAHKMSQSVRMDLIASAVDECLARTGGVVTIDVKEFVALSHEGIQAMLERGGDGLILADKTLPVTFGSDPGLLKWKAPHLSTVDLVVDRKRCGAHYSKLARLRTSDGKATSIPDVRVEDVPGALPAIWEFGFVNGAWRPLHRREDKHKANSAFVVNQTMRNVVDVIGAFDLVSPIVRSPNEDSDGPSNRAVEEMATPACIS